MVEQNQQSELAAAIDVEKQRIKVDPYYATAMNKGLKGHAMGFWSGTAMGLVSGGLIGATLFLAPWSAPVMLPLGGLWQSVAVFAGIAGVAGGTVGSRVGSSAGVTSGVIAEFERRQKADKLETEILRSPELQQQAIERYRTNPVVEKDDTLGETFSTSKDTFSAIGKVVDIRTMAMTIGLCALAGAAMFLGGYAIAAAVGVTEIAGIGIGTLTAGSAPAAAMFGAVVGGGVGVTFGITFPMVFATLTKGVGNLLSGKVADGLTGHQPEPELPALPSVAAQHVPQHNYEFQRQYPRNQISDVAHHERLADASLIVHH